LIDIDLDGLVPIAIGPYAYLIYLRKFRYIHFWGGIRKMDTVADQVTEDYIQLAIRSMEHAQIKYPTMLQKNVKMFQSIVERYCKDTQTQSMNWRQTGLTLKGILMQMEFRNYIKLDPTRTFIYEVISAPRGTKENLDPQKNSPESNDANKKVTAAHIQDSQLVFKHSTQEVQPTQVVQETLTNTSKTYVDLVKCSYQSPKRREVKRQIVDLATEQLPHKKVKYAPTPVVTKTIFCPICNLLMDTADELLLNTHVDECLTMKMLAEEASTKHIRDDPPLTEKLSLEKAQFVVQVLGNTLGHECTICFEQLSEGQCIARLECMCVFHKDCIYQWFEKSSFCPLHTPTKIHDTGQIK